MSEKADFEPSLKRASHFVKIIVACPHRLPKLPESTLRKQARPNNGSLFCSHCGHYLVVKRTINHNKSDMLPNKANIWTYWGNGSYSII
jgi:hypothetical protein